MAGIYIHIPFCRKACHYCNFHFSTKLEYIDRMVDALIRELVFKSSRMAGVAIKTVYFGGGTPSLLQHEDLARLLDTIHEYYLTDQLLELTLEANPEDLTSDKIRSLRLLGVNRLSIGIQSIHDKELNFMNRAHDSATAINALLLAQDAGIVNISVDLMFGLLNSTHAMWEENLRVITGLNIPHLSCYNLTIEEQTALSHWVKHKKVATQPEDYQHGQYYFADRFLSDLGYDHYEISNYALPGQRSIHNSQYWNGTNYLGIGPSAHSFINGHRSWNVSNNQLYLSQADQRNFIPSIEDLTISDTFNEMLMLRLRTAEGIRTTEMNRFPNAFKEHWSRVSQLMIDRKQLVITDERITLARAYWYMSDHLISELFFID